MEMIHKSEMILFMLDRDHMIVCVVLLLFLLVAPFEEEMDEM